MNRTVDNPIFAVAAEFSSAADILRAAREVRQAGYRRWEVYSPVPVERIDGISGARRSGIGLIAFFGGLVGFVLAVAMQIVPTLWLYPLDIAGKPAAFWFSPTIFPVIFEMTVLFSAFATVLGMFLLGGLPRLHHPMFNWDRFDGVSRDKFVIAIEAADSKFAEDEVLDLLKSLGAEHVAVVRED